VVTVSENVGKYRGHCASSVCRVITVIIVSEHAGKLPWSLLVITVVIVSTEILFTNEQVMVIVSKYIGKLPWSLCRLRSSLLMS